jgi:hypothetical protein
MTKYVKFTAKTADADTAETMRQGMEMLIGCTKARVDDYADGTGYAVVSYFRYSRAMAAQEGAQVTEF